MAENEHLIFILLKKLDILSLEMRNNRTRSEIIIDMLNAVSTNPELRTTVLYKCRLSYGQLMKYSKFLSEKGLIAETEDGKWVCSDKGRAYLSAYVEAEKIIKSLT
jgi:predicted transcriptional regulator